MTLHCPECYSPLTNFDNEGRYCQHCKQYYPQHETDRWIEAEIKRTQSEENALYEMELMAASVSEQNAAIKQNIYNNLIDCIENLTVQIDSKNRNLVILKTLCAAMTVWAMTMTGILFFSFNLN